MPLPLPRPITRPMSRPRCTLPMAVRASAVVVSAATLALAGVVTTSASSTPGTTVRGWSTSTIAVEAGSIRTFSVTVRTGGTRQVRRVRLQVRRAGATSWSKGSWSRTSRRGNAALSWQAPARATELQVRVQVRAVRGTARGATTRARRVAVADSQTATLRAEVLQLVNQARSVPRVCGTKSFAAAGPLVAQGDLRAAAQGHASDMAANDYFAHTSLDGRSPWDRIAESGYAGFGMSENIAAGFATAQGVVDGWLNSPGHCANLMNPTATQLGVGHASAPGSTYGHYWVQNFGR